MSLSSQEVVRRQIDAFGRGDLAAWIELFDEDVVWVPVEMPDIQTVTGKVAVLDLMQSYLEPWDQLDLETIELEEHGETVLWTFAQTVSQKDSGLSFKTEMSAVFEVRDSLVTHARFFWGRDEARDAIGPAA